MSRPKGTKQQNFRVTPDNQAVTALAALYQGEKTDASYVFNTAMVMMGVAVAYLVGAIPFVGKIFENNKPFDWLFLLLLPIPLWLIAAFHSLMTLNAMSHGISVRIIEDALFEASELRVKRALVGSAAGDRIMDITQAKAAHILTTVVVYGGVAFLVIGFTAYALYSANVIVTSPHASVVTSVHAPVVHPLHAAILKSSHAPVVTPPDAAVVAPPDAPVVEIAIAIYSLLAIMVAFSWIEGFRIINKGRSEIPTHVKSSGSNAG